MAEPTEFETFASFTYEPELRESFAAEPLIEAWAARYPDLFDALDVRTAKNQATLGYRFVEWFTAVRLFEDLGLSSLHEGYTYKTHEAKRARLIEIAGEPLRAVLATVPRGDQFRFPDLFVYRPGTPEWFFVEVKGPGDRLRESQIRFFSTLGAAVGRPVRLVTVHAADGGSPVDLR